MRFSLSPLPIDPDALRRELARADAGALATFEGWVRNSAAGRAVRALEYDVYAPLAEKEGTRILAEVRERFAVCDAVCVHRTGLLAVGEIAVWVGVCAGHRDAAFSACRYIIDELKARAPLWKKEHWMDGAAAWVDPVESAGQSPEKARKPGSTA